MSQTMSATEARVHFGEVLRKVEDNIDVVVERNNTPVAVIISPERFRQLTESGAGSDWLERAQRSSESAAQWLAGKPLPDIDEMINTGHDVG
jgi:prevent-host-death family protein